MRRWTRTWRRFRRASAERSCACRSRTTSRSRPDATLVEIDPRDYQIAVDKAQRRTGRRRSRGAGRAEQRADHVDDGRAAASPARKARSIRRRRASTRRRRASKPRGRGSPPHRPGCARPRPTRPEPTRDVERLKGLLAKDEVSQQQYDAAVAAADGAARGRRDARRRQVVEAEAGIRVAREPARAGARRPSSRRGAGLRTAQTAPEQVAAIRRGPPPPRRTRSRRARCWRRPS